MTEIYSHPQPEARMHRSLQYQAGLTLIELMVSMTIGIFIIAVLIGFYSNSNSTSNYSKAQLQMAEDGQFVLKLLTNQIRLAGYNPIQPNRVTLPRNPIGAAVANTRTFTLFGCASNFSNVATATNSEQLTCGTNTASHAISVRYEADIYNTLATSTPPLRPTDCLGQGLTTTTAIEALPPSASASHNYNIAENRFFVVDNSLRCSGSGLFDVGQSIVDNVDSIEFSYGVGITSTNVIAGYLTADEIGPGPGSATAPTNAAMAALPTAYDRWQLVKSVRICVIMRSANTVPMVDGAHRHYGCNPQASATAATPILTTDGFLRRAFVTTVSLRNRIAVN